MFSRIALIVAMMAVLVPITMAQMNYTFSKKTGELSFEGYGGIDQAGIHWIIGGYENTHLIKSVNFSKGGIIENIPPYTFTKCANLTKITLPTGLEKIWVGAFYECTNLQYVSFPEGLISIDAGAFSDCISLKTVILPEGLKELGEGAFSGCKELESIVLPASLTEYGDDAFADCINLKSITCLCTTEPKFSCTFENNSPTSRIVYAPNANPKNWKAGFWGGAKIIYGYK